MKASELKKLLSEGALSKYAHLYSDVAEETERFIEAIDAFSEKYGAERDIHIFSVPGRSEISGNHTDHNNGKVLAGAINRDIIAIAAKNTDGKIRFQSKGYDEDIVEIKDITEKPTMNFLTNTGMYIVDQRIVDELEENHKCGFPDIIEKYRNLGEKVGVYPVSENSWMDMGQLEELEDMRRRLENR